jgi:hypothetical protein
MNEKTDGKRTEMFWKVAFGMAAAGFVVIWGQPAGPIAALPMGLLAMWLRRRASAAAVRQPALAPASRKS